MNIRLLLAALSVFSIAACRPASDRRDGPPPSAGTAAAAPDSGAANSAAAFVRAFYDAYAPRGHASGLAATDSLLRERPTLFAPALLALLRGDAAARAAADGEIDGLDFDPFLNSQDPCDRYEVVGGAAPAGASVPGAMRVSVRAVCGGARSPDPAVTAEVAPTGGAWQFVNFFYGPPAGDLVALLRRLHPPAA